jgi:TonB-linked SusC/RagA family outer membrane protein
MKKINDKQLLFFSNHSLKLTIMKKLCILSLLLSMATFTVGAVTPMDEETLQQVNLTGKVTDAATGEALIGVTILVKGTTTGTLTDINGNFAIPVTGRQAVTLQISFIGYSTQEVTATPGTPVNVALALEVTQIQEVVVVGYGTQKKESVVGAITQVNNEALVKSGISNITNAIAGKLTGVLTMQQVGEPGRNDAEIVIRGISSWNSSAPLVLVDGVERDFTDIDPNEINTISVLKDASATAVFGAKGANGVIIVTTKRGMVGRPKMSFSTLYGIERAIRLPEHISSYRTMSLLNVGLMNDQKFTELVPDNILEEYRNPSTPLNSLRYPDVNWFDLLTNPSAPTWQANFNIQGGSQKVKYFGSLGYFNQEDFFKGYRDQDIDTRFNYDRFNYRGNLDFSLTKSTDLSVNLGGEVGVRNTPRDIYSLWVSLYNVGPSRFPAYFPEWVLDVVPDPDYPDASGIRYAQSFGERYDNPYARFNMGSFDRYLESKLYTDLLLDQKLDFLLKGLSVKGKASLSTYYNHRSLYASYPFPQYQLFYNRIGVDANGDGKVDQNPWYRMDEGLEVFKMEPLDVNVGGMMDGYYTDLYYEVSLNYANSFGRHNVTGLALLNRQQKNRGTEFPYYNEALVGRVTYDYFRKYLVELNLGYTGSERFAPGNRFGFFPSVAVGWTVSEEQFFKNAVPWMSKLKLRYSDGLVGSDYASTRWLYISEYSNSTVGATMGLPSVPTIVEDRGANSTAQWEQARKRDIGVELGIFKNVFTLGIDLFDEYRDKMLLSPRTVTMIVGNSFKDLNLGEIKKHGFEVEAEYNRTTASGLNYFVKGIFGFSENRIIFRDDMPYAPEHTKSAGKPIDAQLNGVYLSGTGYWTSVDDIHIETAPLAVSLLNVGDYKFVDYNADGTITSLDRYPIKGSYYPPITYSLTGGFSYKGFDFNCMFQGNAGKYVQFNMSYEMEYIMGDWKIGETQLDFWRPDYQTAKHATLHYYSGGGGLPNLGWGGGQGLEGYEAMVEDRLWRNSDYIRLKNLYAGYTFNPEFLKRIGGISNLNIFFIGTNLLTFTKLPEGDPERKQFLKSTDYEADTGTGFYPMTLSLKLGLKFDF